MADLAQLEAALVKADAAGNVDDARVLANAIRSMRAGQSEDPTLKERGQAVLGGVNRGIAGLVGLPVDTAENIANLGIAGVGSVANLAGRPDLAPNLIRGTFGGSESIAALLNKAGIGTTNPRPDDAASRMLHTAGVIGGGSMIPGAGVKPALTAAAGGAVAGEALGPEWVGVGAMTPAAAGQAVTGMRNAITAKTAPNVQTFKEAGAMPSAGQATQSVFLSGLENLAAKFPGGAGVMRKFIEKQQADFGSRARTGVPAEEAGRAIESGVRGEGGFLERFRATQDKLYSRLDRFIPNDKTIDVSRTKEALADLNADIPGAPNVSKFFKNEKIQSIEGALKKDTSGLPAAEQSMDPFRLAMAKTLPMSEADRKALFAAFDQGQLPYEAVKKLRTLVGREISDGSLVSTVPKSKWKALYAALSDDLGVAAQSSGPQAERAWKVANDYSRSGMKRIDNVLDRVIGKGSQPEDIFKRFFPTDPDQANKVRAVMRSLKPEERQIVSQAVANRLGRATPGHQGDVGDVFSSETFLTNWNKLSSGAKAQLFPDPPLRENMERLARAAANIREGKGIYSNPSGTAGSFAAYSVYASPIASIATGSPAPVVAAGGAATAAYLGAKMLTSPRVVEWLAKPINPSKPGEAVGHLARLAVIYNQSDEATKAELDRFMQSIK